MHGPGLLAFARINLACSRIGSWRVRLHDRSRMNREVHVRFWEGAGLQCPALLD